MTADQIIAAADALLGEVYTDAGIEIWWHARNRNLGSRRPLDVLADEPGRVLAEAERIAGGAR